MRRHQNAQVAPVISLEAFRARVASSGARFAPWFDAEEGSYFYATASRHIEELEGREAEELFAEDLGEVEVSVELVTDEPPHLFVRWDIERLSGQELYLLVESIELETNGLTSQQTRISLGTFGRGGERLYAEDLGFDPLRVATYAFSVEEES